MAFAGKALSGVASAVKHKVKPGVVAGIHPALQKASPTKAVTEAPSALAATVTPEQKELIDHGYVWGVTWPGHVDKYHGKEVPYFDAGEFKSCFKTWDKFSFGTEYLTVGFSVLGSVMSSKLPGAKH
mmetsp:Transcript_78077/g.135422  ORF Transcript_78077/g.135422 Transcript_78077/m.135422 type:complete len:127 (+) Transcript_78077:74-454(+)